MNLLLRPGPFNPTPYLPRFRFEQIDDIQGNDEQDDDEIIPIIVAIYARTSL